MTIDEYRQRLGQMNGDELAIEWVVQASLYRRLVAEIEELGSAGTTGIRPREARNLFLRYLELYARFDLVDDLARVRLAP